MEKTKRKIIYKMKYVKTTTTTTNAMWMYVCVRVFDVRVHSHLYIVSFHIEERT